MCGESLILWPGASMIWNPSMLHCLTARHARHPFTPILTTAPSAPPCMRERERGSAVCVCARVWVCVRLRVSDRVVGRGEVEYCNHHLLSHESGWSAGGESERWHCSVCSQVLERVWATLWTCWLGSRTILSIKMNGKQKSTECDVLRIAVLVQKEQDCSFQRCALSVYTEEKIQRPHKIFLHFVCFINQLFHCIGNSCGRHIYFTWEDQCSSAVLQRRH